MDLLPLVLNILGLIIVALINVHGNRTTHALVNSRMSEMLELAKKNWREGRADEQQRVGVLVDPIPVTAGPLPVVDEQAAITNKRIAMATEESAEAMQQIAKVATNTLKEGETK